MITFAVATSFIAIAIAIAITPKEIIPQQAIKCIKISTDHHRLRSDDFDDLPDPIESGEEVIEQLKEAIEVMQSIVDELKSLEKES